MPRKLILVSCWFSLLRQDFVYAITVAKPLQTVSKLIFLQSIASIFFKKIFLFYTFEFQFFNRLVKKLID